MYNTRILNTVSCKKCHVNSCHFLILLFSYRVNSALQTFGQILRTGGVAGLWKGWVPNVQRAALVNMGGECVCVCVWSY